MPLTVPAQVTRTQRLPVPRDRAFELLLDLPAWAALFPRVDTIEPMDQDASPDAPGPSAAQALGAYRWTMVPLGPPGLEMVTVYACHYAADRDAGRLTWTPVEGVGNARFSGEATLSTGDAEGCDLALRIDAELEIPAPRIVRGIVEAAVHFEFGRTVDTFLDNVADRLAGGV